VAVATALVAIVHIAPIVAATAPATDADARVNEPHPSDVGLLP
jgi:hypothetical protein